MMGSHVSAEHAAARRNSIYSAGTMLSLYATFVVEEQVEESLRLVMDGSSFCWLLSCRSEGGRICAAREGSLKAET